MFTVGFLSLSENTFCFDCCSSENVVTEDYMSPKNVQDLKLHNKRTYADFTYHCDGVRDRVLSLLELFQEGNCNGNLDHLNVWQRFQREVHGFKRCDDSA